MYRNNRRWQDRWQSRGHSGAFWRTRLHLNHRFRYRECHHEALLRSLVGFRFLYRKVWRFESSLAHGLIVNQSALSRITLYFQGFLRLHSRRVHRHARRCVRVLQRILQRFRLARFQPLGRSARRSVASSVSPRPAGSFRSTHILLAREIHQPIPFHACCEDSGTTSDTAPHSPRS
jgi:hypothetical protein